MNILLIEQHELVDNRVLLHDRRAEHLVKILKSREGDTVRVGVIDGAMGRAEIVSLKCRYPFMAELLVEFAGEAPPPLPNIDLLLALPRPIMLRRILSQAAALGVGSVTLVNAGRVEKSFWNAQIMAKGAWREHLLHGLEQGVDTRVPQVELQRRFRPFVEDVLPARVKKYSHSLVAHPDASSGLGAVVPSSPARTLLAIGPEGGWGDFEIKQLRAAGCIPFTMGPRILKVDTAVVALHSRLTFLSEIYESTRAVS
ncbi:MAG: 16S rRNA (uracil(1498)-N(3))-methyltransferase [Desulfobulbaceae bacterium]|uniref:Ribosomal RNA small subunit methyltransferase E n=1 Tax=Candidatus Desulfatifera sulfidica TaxID=2841691 RepID=A0A8J6N779_9BACT|nr:16S rRNA (uracil(1498)-N(3))-methyltransferase [Candidatus Desulfatifera sulfidica]